MALLTLEYTRGLPIEFVILLTFLAGCIELLMGLLDLGNIFQISTNEFNTCYLFLSYFDTYLTEEHSQFFLSGFLVDFISLPVTSSFTSATSVIIIVSQLQGLVGLKYRSSNLVEQVYKFFENIPKIKYPDAALGISSIVILLLLRVSQSNSKERDTC